jgi:hypothetical protein
MTNDTQAPRTRRAVLLTAAGAAAATVLGGVARPSDVDAADGDPLLLGQANAAASLTSLTSPSPGLSVHATFGQALIGISDGDVSWTDCGVYGRVSGSRAAAIVASNSSGGTALYVNGKVNLIKRSGRVDVPAGADHVDVDLQDKGGLSGSSLCYATLMSFRDGVFVAAMRPNYPSSGRARIHLNRAAPATMRVAWLVLN